MKAGNGTFHGPVEGRDLGAIAAEGPLSPQRAAGYLKTIAEAIDFAHQRGTMHRVLEAAEHPHRRCRPAADYRFRIG